MITAVDTAVLLDVFSPDPVFGPRSKEAIRNCLREGALLACDVVWAEVAGFFKSEAEARESMTRLGISFRAMTVEAALLAGSIWRRYRLRGGTRERMIPDFLIGAHALLQSDRLLTRDRGFYRSYFKDLPIIDASKS